MLVALTVLLVYPLTGEVIVQFAGPGMGLNGLTTAILMPLLIALWRWAA